MRAWPLALILLLSACGGSGTTGAQPSRSSTPPPATTPAPSLPAPVVENRPVTFSTAGGSVACDLEQAYARCDVKSPTWTAPKRPSDCHNSWGHAVEVSAGTPSTFICWFGASPLGAKRVLAANQAITVGLMTCRAVTGGVECSGQGHGFRLGRASYRLS